ncbi:hypothetical protein MHYP_G00220360 [Metynnis hypsauchen]
MPAILLVSKMKSGLPKPAHSAAPKTHIPTRAVAPQPNIAHTLTTSLKNDQPSGIKPQLTTSQKTDQTSSLKTSMTASLKDDHPSGLKPPQLSAVLLTPTRPADGAADPQLPLVLQTALLLSVLLCSSSNKSIKMKTSASFSDSGRYRALHETPCHSAADGRPADGRPIMSPLAPPWRCSGLRGSRSCLSISHSLNVSSKGQASVS